MTDEPDMSRLARTIGEPTRMRMLTLLMEGRALTAKELAYGSGVEPATATSHLRRLADDLLVSATTQGRHKYFRLTSPRIAELIESLMVIAQRQQPSRQQANPVGKADPVIRSARFCYDHLAGQLGVRLTDAMLERGLLVKTDMPDEQKSFTVTTTGVIWCASFGIDLAELRKSRRQLAFQCLDWSERKDHLAGALGAAIAERMIALGWIVKNKHSRAVSITVTGELALATQFGISLKSSAATD